MSIFSKIGKSIKKVVKNVGKYIAPIASIAAPFIPGVGGLVSSAIGKVGGMFNADSTDVGMGAPNAGPQEPQVQVSGQSPNTNWTQPVTAAISGGLSYLGQSQANAANAQQAQKQMDFQNQQTSTAYQRGTEDMRKAGLNPMLAYSQGGAGSGSGASADIQNEFQPGVNSAFSAMKTMQELDQMRAQVDLIDSQSRNTDAQTATELGRPGLVKAQTTDTKQSAEQREANIQYQLLKNRLMRETFDAQVKETSSAADLRGHQERAEKYRLSEGKSRSDFWQSSYGKMRPYTEAAGEDLNSAASFVRKLIPVPFMN